MSATGVRVATPLAGTEVVFVEGMPRSIEGAVRVGAHIEARRGDLLVHLPGIARYRVRDARRIEIEPEPGVSQDVAAHFATITPLGAIIHQRGELPLHASAVVPPGGGDAILLAGRSGQGKSTLAAAFVHRGWHVLNDDLSRVTTAGGRVLVWPGSNTLKLGSRSCKLLAMDPGALPGVPGQPEKLAWRQPGTSEAAGIAAIVELESEGECSGPLRPLVGSEAMRLLVRQTFRRLLVQPLGCQLTHFAMLDTVVRYVPCYQLSGTHRLAPARLAECLAELTP